MGKQCVICGAEFKPKQGRQVCCANRECQRERRRQTQEVHNRKQREEVKSYRVNNYQMVEVEVKCPHCEKIHTLKMAQKPNVMPRVFCRKCEYKRAEVFW